MQVGVRSELGLRRGRMRLRRLPMVVMGCDKRRDHRKKQEETAYCEEIENHLRTSFFHFRRPFPGGECT